MKNMKHTKSPWVFPREDCAIRYTINNTNNRHIAMVSCFESSPSDRDENLANAKLIAAAPEMLEALMSVDNYFSERGEDDWVRFCKEALEPVRKAIKLAIF